MLPRHPTTYRLEELEEWIRHLVDQQVPEGKRLDYKEQPSLSSDKGRREAAKDISSFANEVGGVLLYGISESRTDDRGPVPQRPYGMEPVLGLAEQLENIYVDTIRPNLGDYRIVCVPLSENPDKVVYMVWTPESWLGPHMIEAYNDRRYYRRGQFRAVKMAEHEVRDRYERMQRTRERLDEFLSSADVNFPAPYFFDSPTCGSHYIVAPLMLYDRIDFTQADTRRWLQANPYPKVSGQWTPFPNGVRTPLEDRESALTKRRVYWDFVQLFRTGAMSHWSETKGRDEGTEIFSISSVVELRKVEDFLVYAGKVLHIAGYTGPVHIEGTTRSSKPKIRLAAGSWPDEWPFLLAPDGAVRISCDQPSSDLINDPKIVLRRVANEMCRAFGWWDATAFFDKEGNLGRG